MCQVATSRPCHASGDEGGAFRPGTARKQVLTPPTGSLSLEHRSPRLDVMVQEFIDGLGERSLRCDACDGKGPARCDLPGWSVSGYTE